MSNASHVAVALIAALLTACGGGGGGSSGGGGSNPPPTSEAPIQSGNWVDVSISGLSYVSGTITGATSATGGYTYRCPSGCDSIRFALGGITIGQATGAATLTLRELQGGLEGGVLSSATLRRGQFCLHSMATRMSATASRSRRKSLPRLRHAA